MKTLAIFVLALFAVVMAQDRGRVKVVDNNPILEDSLYLQPSAPHPPNPNGYPQQQGQVRPNYGPAYVKPGGDYREGWTANHKVPPGARGGK